MRSAFVLGALMTGAALAASDSDGPQALDKRGPVLVSSVCTTKGCDDVLHRDFWIDEGQFDWDISNAVFEIKVVYSGYSWKEWHVHSHDWECQIQDTDKNWSPWRRGKVSRQRFSAMN